MSTEDSTQNRRPRQKWSEHIPPQLKVAIDWTRWLLRPALALVALYSCLFVLQIVGLAPRLASERQRLGLPPTLSLQLEPAAMFSDHDLIVTGHTQPGLYVEVGVNQRLLGNTMSDLDGNFRVPIATTLQVNRIWARVLDPTTGDMVAEGTVPFELGDDVPYTPMLDVAIYIEDADWLWVAGRAVPKANLEMETQDGDSLGVVNADELGIFDCLLPFDSAQPNQLLLQVRDRNRDKAQVSVPVPVTQLPLAEIPLARIANVNLKADKSAIHMRIELPGTHPYFIALNQGYLSADQFLVASFGWPTGFGWLPGASEMVYTSTLSSQSGTGVTELQGEWSWPTSEFSLGRGDGSGIGSIPLLTAKDQITLHFDEIRPAWFGDLLPTELEPDTATWRGPIAASGSNTVIQVGFDLPAEVLAQRWLPRPKQPEQPTASEEEKQRAEEKMRGFLANIESRVTGGFVSQTWRTMILLIPYAGLLWLAQRRTFGRPEAWKPIMALVLVLAVWRSWNYFYFLLLAGPASWLQRIITPARYALGMGGSEIQSRFLADVGSHIFWLLFIPCIALVPYYLPVVEGRLGWRPTVSSVRHPLPRRLWRGARTIYGTIVLALLLLTTQLNNLIRLGWLQPSSYEQAADYLQRTWDLGSSMAHLIISIPLDDTFRSVLQIVLLVLLLLAFSGRGALWGVGLLAVALRALVSLPYMPLPPGLTPIGNLINQVPWWSVVVFSGLTAYPLVLRLLHKLAPAPPDERPRWPFRRLALILIFVSMTLAYLPPRWLLVVGGALMIWAIGWLTVAGLRELEPVKSLAAWARRWPQVFFAALVGAALLMIWPIPSPGTALQHRDLFRLVAELDGLFAYILALALILLMRGYALGEGKKQVILGPPALEVAAVLFAAFLLNSSARWLFIPVPFLVGLLMTRFWLFQPMAAVRKQRSVLVKAAGDRKRLIQDILDAASAKTRFETIHKALVKKLEAAELKLEEYKAKSDSYEQEFEQNLALEEVKPGYLSRDIVFTVGEMDLWKNTQIVIRYGAVLAAIPLLIALYEYLPLGQVRYPYPVANLIIFLIQSIASWLLYAFFFGYYYVHLRGNSGLGKGLILFVGLVVPFAVYRLLSTQTLEEMRPFFLWTTQIFLFCTLLGLLSADYRLLRQNGFQIRDLLAVHNLPVLSVYASSVVAAITPTIIAILTGRLGDLVKFFLESVLPRVPTGGP